MKAFFAIASVATRIVKAVHPGATRRRLASFAARSDACKQTSANTLIEAIVIRGEREAAGRNSMSSGHSHVNVGHSQPGGGRSLLLARGRANCGAVQRSLCTVFIRSRCHQPNQTSAKSGSLQ